MSRAHNCVADTLLQVELIQHGVYETKGVVAPQDWECPICLEGEKDPSSSVSSCSCGKIPARLNCGHWIHVGCYNSLFIADKQECPTCRVIPKWTKTKQELEEEEMMSKPTPVPAKIDKLELVSLGGSATLNDVDSSKTVFDALWPTAVQIIKRTMIIGDGDISRYDHRKVTLLSMGRPLDWNTPLASYPNLHLDKIVIRTNFLG